MEPQIPAYDNLSATQTMEQPDDHIENQGISKQNDEVSESPILKTCIVAKSCNASGGDKPNRKPHKARSTLMKGFKKSITSNSQPEDKHSMTYSFKAGSDENKHTTSSDATHPPDAIKLEKEGFVSNKKHPLHLYISDILNTTSNISLPAHHLLNCLTITEPIPLPLFYVEELNNVVMNTVSIKRRRGYKLNHQ